MTSTSSPSLPPRMDLSDNCQRSSGCFQSCGCRATPGSLNIWLAAIHSGSAKGREPSLLRLCVLRWQ